MLATIPTSDADTSLERARAIRLIAFDFDGVFTDNMVYVFEDGREAVRCTRSDGIGLRRIEKLGIQTVVISTEANPVVSARCRKLKIRCIQDCPDKEAALRQLADELGVPLEQVAFVGNDVNDLPALTIAGLAVVVQDAHPSVLAYAHYQTQTPGGSGAVREVCDWLADLQQSSLP